MNDISEICKLVEAQLTKDMQSADSGWQPWECYDHPPKINDIGQCVEVGQYNDGYISHGRSFLWVEEDGPRLFVVNPYRQFEIFTDVSAAIKFLLEV